MHRTPSWRSQLRGYFSGTGANPYFMNFATYDILSKALPGAVVYLALLLGKFISKPTDIGDVLTLVVIYLLGYFIDALASITEPGLFWLMGGSPGARILTEDYKGRIFVAQRAALCTHLQTLHPDLEIGSRKLFAVVASVANAKGSTRLTEFQGAYAFARNILTALVIAEIIGFVAPLSWPLLLLFAGLIILSFSRVKQRGYYWAREAANIYIDCRSVAQPKAVE